MKKLRVDVWSDIACPWCYVGKRRLESALAKFEHRDDVEVVWRAFELDPSAVRTEGSYAVRLARKYGSTVEVAEGRLRAMAETGAKDGIEFRFDRARSGNTFNAHRLLHLAGDRGVQDAMKERVMHAYMTEGEDITDPETLVRLASDAGLDAEEARGVLSSDTYTTDVRSDESEARQLGINGVPFFVIGRYGVSGAQPAETLLEVLTKAWSETPEVSQDAIADGAACGVDECA
jgi:predicted DsbA family dithiol-disulfide isomerase